MHEVWAAMRRFYNPFIRIHSRTTYVTRLQRLTIKLVVPYFAVLRSRTLAGPTFDRNPREEIYHDGFK
jgi:hypothetical protein